MASLIAVLRKEWMPMPRPPSRLGSMPAARQYFLTSPPGRLAVEVAADQAGGVGRHRAEEGAFPVVRDAGPPQVVQHRPGCVEEDLPPLLIALFGDVEEVAWRCVSEGVEFFCTPDVLMAAMSWAVSQEISPLAASCR
jgi:hypothetical protein